MEDLLTLFLIFVAFGMGLYIGLSGGQDFMLDWICEDNGYYTGHREYGTRYCVTEDREFVPLDHIIIDWEAADD